MSTTLQEVKHPSNATLHAAHATQPATILLAEDDRSIRRYLEVTLTRAGFKVIAAADGLEAMKALLSTEVDALITDAVMPHLNGYELCRFLRQHPRLSMLPVVFLSGVDQSAAPVRDADAARADVYLAKPVRAEELTDCLTLLLTAK